MEIWQKLAVASGGSGLLTLFLVLGAASAYGVYRLIYNIYFHPLAQYPGPAFAVATKLPVAYHILKGHTSPWLLSLHEYYQSDIVRFAPDEISIINPAGWKDIYAPSKTAAHDHFLRDETLFRFRKNILTCPEAEHKRLHRLISPAFSEKALREQEELLVSHVREFINALTATIPSRGSQGRIDLRDQIMFFSFDVIGDLSFGFNLNCQQASSYHPWALGIMSAITFLVSASVMERFPPLSRLLMNLLPKSKMKAFEEHMEWCRERVEQRLKSDTERPDIMSFITRYDNDPEKKGLSMDELTENASILISAGAETTASLLAGAVYHLLHNSSSYERLVNEIRSSFKSAGDICIQSIKERLPFLQAVMDETFRIYPPVVSGTPRVCPPGGAWVANHWIPAATRVVMNQHAINHSGQNFEQPEQFAPERWLDESQSEKSGDEKWNKGNRDALQPFGWGAYQCIGRNLALAEIRLILTHLLFTFDIKVTDETDQNWPDQRDWFVWVTKPLVIGVERRDI